MPADDIKGAPGGTEAVLEQARVREAATREILQVISRSRDDEGPVFDVILETAARLCSAPFACLFRVNAERTHLTIPAHFGTRPQFVDLINSDPLPMDPSQSQTAKAIFEKRSLQVPDFSDDPIYRSGQPQRVYAVEVEGARQCGSGLLDSTSGTEAPRRGTSGRKAPWRCDEVLVLLREATIPRPQPQRSTATPSVGRSGAPRPHTSGAWWPPRSPPEGSSPFPTQCARSALAQAKARPPTTRAARPSRVVHGP